MRQFILFFLVFPAITFASHYDGFYLAGGLGSATDLANQRVVTNSLDADVTVNQDAKYSPKISKNAFLGDFFLGYGHVFNYFFLGADVGVSLSGHRKPNSRFSSYDKLIGGAVIDHVTLDDTMKRHDIAGHIDTLYGVLFPSQALLNLHIGAEITEIKNIIDSTFDNIPNGFSGSLNVERSTTKIAPTVGLDLVAPLAAYLDLETDYTLSYYSTPSQTAFGTCGVDCRLDVDVKNKLLSQTFLLNLIYRPDNSDIPLNLTSDAFSDGFGVGLDGGINRLVSHTPTSVTTTDNLQLFSDYSMKLTKNRPMMNIFSQYQHKIGHLLIGLEVDNVVGPTAQKAQYLAEDNFENSDEHINQETKTKMGAYHFVASFDPGFLLTPQTALYLKLGATIADLKLESNTVAEDRFGDLASGELRLKKSKIKVGYQVGLGLAEKITAMLGLRMQLIFENFGQLKVSDTATFSVGNGSVSNTVQSKFFNSSVTLGLFYQFV